jgi:transcriptional antiterminator
VQKRRLKRKKIPEYRRIKNYYKSTAQYWKERSRRQQVLKLTNEGYTLQQIAKEIGCSYRTVRRDAVKLERYVKGKFNSYMEQLQREAREKLNRELDGLSIKDMGKRFQALTRLMFRTRKLSKREIEKQHNNIIFIDFDKSTLNGDPAIKIGYPHSTFKTPYNISLVSVRNGKMKVLGGIKIG